ncbi:threonine-phosphate decarboxylase CobD [Bacillus sp. V5-8f]|uniref:threonine-phosphate decarboxylase CobD n=1 Tax=Bacillus sp. V5-8f TaxID=2053044 RepID=UPI000C7892F6|nr:threonine-phosphate decarboxylase CobD [Bacillus sp. V5-8f]PLT35941.1 threonine-phosphate decarboxylase [Bacillus sp. V5-8f]
MLLPSHGSNSHYLYESLKIAKPSSIIDFSANINPLGPSSNLEERWLDSFHLVKDYPDPQAEGLLRLLAAKEKLTTDMILIGNGGAELITLIGRFLSGKKVLILQPSFSEYEQACISSGCEVSYHILKEGSWELELEPLLPLIEKVDALFLCTPNNPTGVSFKEEAVLQLLEECKSRQCLVIIDEAFHDFLDHDFTYARGSDPQHGTAIKYFPNLLILRSLTKMYAIPGLRLGFLIGDPDIVGQISRFRPHWSVNSLAIMAGELSLRDEKHIEATRNLIRQERTKLIGFFKKYDFSISDSQVNFYLLRDERNRDSLSLLKFLMEKGIVPRHTYNFPGLDGRWLRFAVKNSQDNERLMEVLEQWRNHPSFLSQEE